MGLVDKADNVTHRVLDLVDQLSWGEAFGPFFMPFPIEAEAFRPLSVLGLKAYASLMGVGPPPLWFAFLKSMACLTIFAFCARKWLQAVGLSRHAELAALLPLGLAPVLFQVWYLPELDLFGAGATLWLGATILQRRPLSRRAWALVLGCLLFVLFLKESTALVQLAFFGATGCLLWMQGLRGSRFARHWKLGVGAAVLWGLVVLPLMGGEESMAGRASIWTRVSLVEHNLVQVLYLVSFAGAVLVLLGGIFSWRSWPKRPLRWVLPLSLLLLCLAPVAVFYSHYEAVYFSPRWMGSGLVLCLFLGLFSYALNHRREPALALCAGQVLLVTGALSAAGILAPNAREDMASRVFVALAPALFALALNAAQALREHLPQEKRNPARASLFLLWAGLIYAPFAQTINYTMDWRARHEVDLAGKMRMAQIHKGDLVLFNHYVEWLDPLGLMAAGAPPTVLDWQFLHVPAWLPLTEYKRARWIYPGLLDLERELSHRSAHIYWLSPRAQMSKSAREGLLGDLSWTRKPLGLFSPIAKGLHNRPEDHRMTLFREGPSPLEELMSQGEELWSAEAHSIQVPYTLFEWPRRLQSGLPIVEDFLYEGRLVHLPAGRLEIQEQDPAGLILEVGKGNQGHLGIQ
jgi:hypothetical protein